MGNGMKMSDVPPRRLLFGLLCLAILFPLVRWSATSGRARGGAQEVWRMPARPAVWTTLNLRPLESDVLLELDDESAPNDNGPDSSPSVARATDQPPVCSPHAKKRTDTGGEPVGRPIDLVTAQPLRPLLRPAFEVVRIDHVDRGPPRFAAPGSQLFHTSPSSIESQRHRPAAPRWHEPSPSSLTTNEKPYMPLAGVRTGTRPRARNEIVCALVHGGCSAPSPNRPQVPSRRHQEEYSLVALAVCPTIEEYAKQAGTSRGVVRWTRKRVLEKTGCQRRSKLMLLLAASATGTVRG